MARISPSANRRSPSVKPKIWLNRLLVAGLLVASIALVVFAISLVRLDQDVRLRFAAVQWVLPAQIYAAPLELYPGASLSLAELKTELDRLGYRAADELYGPGSYVVGKNELRIDLRAFNYWDAPREEERIAVAGDAKGLGTVRVLGTDQKLDLVRLDPLLIGSIYPTRSGEDRVLVKLSEVPKLLPQTLVLVEDHGFYEHSGISIRGIVRAAFANLRAGRTKEGASTITQQLVRNLFLTKAQTFKRKITEAFMSLLLERHVSKNDILEAYLNEVSLGQDGPRAVHGFGLASHFYFNKPLNELQPQEVALLVAIVKGPSLYNPRRNPELVLARRNLILGMMRDAGYIRPDQYEIAVSSPLGIARAGSGGAARYPGFVDLVRRQLNGLYKEADLTNEGLRVFTTLDPRVQEALEARIVQDLPDLEKSKKLPPDSLEAAGIVTSVEGGEVLAAVGGRDARFEGFNRAIDAQRPIGSLAKPFLYLTALEQPDRFNLQTLLDDQPIDLKLPNGQLWSPKNYDRQLHGPQPLFMALAKSYNLPTVSLGLQVGINPVRKTFAAAGFDDVPEVPSIFLGAIGMSPLDVAQIYSTLAAGGYETPLLAIREVMTQDGQPLSRYSFKVKQVLPEGPVYLTTWAMQKVIELGTARWASSVLPPGQIFAGKTGTTEDMRDSWFAGFGADRVAVVWVGRDDNKPINMDGAAGALRIWGRLMRDLHARGVDQQPPADIEEAAIDPQSGLRADEGCPGSIVVPFLRDHVPEQYGPCANAAKSSPLNWLKEIFK
jgi:penicillin-binding protein 1B